jgi:hypothetical protein
MRSRRLYPIVSGSLLAVGALGAAGGFAAAGGHAARASHASHRLHVAKISPIPLLWYQGVASDRSGRLYFSGPAVGLYRTDRRLRLMRSVADAIPRQITRGEGYDHIGDLAWDPREHGRLLLPLECYTGGRNTCGRGAIGVADPVSLRWRYRVDVDPLAARKLMWLAWQPGAGRLWTSSGRDLIAFRTTDVRRDAFAPLRPVARLAGVLPAGGVTGGAFWRGRLWLATSARALWSVDVRTGTARRRLKLRLSGESEGLDAGAAGLLWQVQPGIRGLLLRPGRLLRIV